jgi:hypothetical protein
MQELTEWLPASMHAFAFTCWNLFIGVCTGAKHDFRKKEYGYLQSRLTCTKLKLDIQKSAARFSPVIAN